VRRTGFLGAGFFLGAVFLGAGFLGAGLGVDRLGVIHFLGSNTGLGVDVGVGVGVGVGLGGDIVAGGGDVVAPGRTDGAITLYSPGSICVRVGMPDDTVDDGEYVVPPAALELFVQLGDCVGIGGLVSAGLNVVLPNIALIFTPPMAPNTPNDASRLSI